MRVARACDEEDFRDCVKGEGMGCVRGDNLVPGSPGRGGFDIRRRLFGGACVRRHMVSWWVPRGRERQPFGARGSGPAQRRAGTRKAGVLRSPSRFAPPRAQLSTRRRRETRGGRGEGWREAESGAVGVRNGFLARGSRSEARGRRSGAARQRWRIRLLGAAKIACALCRRTGNVKDSHEFLKQPGATAQATGQTKRLNDFSVREGGRSISAPLICITA